MKSLTYETAYQKLVQSRVLCLFIKKIKSSNVSEVVDNMKLILKMTDLDRSIQEHKNDIVLAAYVAFLYGVKNILVKNPKDIANLQAFLLEKISDLDVIQKIQPLKDTQCKALSLVASQADHTALQLLLETSLFKKVRVLNKKDLYKVMQSAHGWEEEPARFLKNIYGPSVLICLTTENLEKLSGTSLRQDILDIFPLHRQEKWCNLKDAPTLVSRFNLLDHLPTDHPKSPRKI